MVTQKIPTLGLALDQDAPLYPEWEYTWRQIFRMLGAEFVLIESDDIPPIVIRYGEPKNPIPGDRFIISIPETLRSGPVHLAAQDKPCRMERVGGPISLPTECFSLFQKKVSASRIIWMQSQSEPDFNISVSENEAICSIDIAATVFYSLSLGNEKRTPKRDQYGRFKSTFSPLGEDYYQTPVVDRLVRLLRELIQYGAARQGVEGFVSVWPHGKSFVTALSHDVDKFQNWTLAKIKRSWQASHSLRPLLLAMSPISRSGNFRFIHELEARYGGSSTTFLVGQKRTKRDPGYSLKDGRIQNQLSSLPSIGLHGSFSGATTSGHTIEERRRVEEATDRRIMGVRSHYLMFDPDQTFNLFTEAGLIYDSTLGFAEAAGWRCGTGFPYHPWNFQERQPHSILELPLVVMDTSLFLYAGLSADQAWERISPILEETKANGSCLAVNWHNNNLHSGDATGYTKLYETILDWSKSNGGWITATDSLIQHWKK
ncbi:hypothetical protein HQ585_03375 [candidate division KSB1 bacterium]|nr:hypothetical protein [candidate division KSB1 bacterium]